MMKNLLFNLGILSTTICSFSLFSENVNPQVANEPASSEGLKKVKSMKLEDSFSYLRAGVYGFIIVPLGAEVGIGHRFRIEHWGYGPLVNVSSGYFAYYAASFKFEGLYYPSGCNGVYFGIMPGVGYAYGTDILYEKRHCYWEFFPNLEFVIGKEYISNDKKGFYYFSINPLLGVSFNMGRSF